MEGVWAGIHTHVKQRCVEKWLISYVEVVDALFPCSDTLPEIVVLPEECIILLLATRKAPLAK